MQPLPSESKAVKESIMSLFSSNQYQPSPLQQQSSSMMSSMGGGIPGPMSGYGYSTIIQQQQQQQQVQMFGRPPQPQQGIPGPWGAQGGGMMAYQNISNYATSSFIPNQMFGSGFVKTFYYILKFLFFYF